ncbi:META domain-containing protein [Mycetocola reblochoni]|uniref:META domain-containing protein n=1 Tax=Mycetocola reblochoni TaxID=331618 RepID=UPI003F9945E3
MKTRVGRIALSFAAAAALVVLAGCSSSGSSFSGTWGSDAKGEPSLTIEADGTFSGTDGCNPVEGTGTISDGTFTFGPFASIQVACEGVTPWLNLAATAQVEGSTLVVYRMDGEEIGSLDKQ